MFRNYLTIAIRHLKKNRGFSLLNMFGLSIGLACAILILLWIEDETSYNRFHKKYDHLYQVLENQTYDHKTFTFSATPGLLAGGMKKDFPEVANACRMDWGNRWLFRLKEKTVYENGNCVDPAFLDIFSFNIKYGARKNALATERSIVLTERMAKKFFGDANPVGKYMKVNDKDEFLVTAVVNAPPDNSSLQFDWLASFKNFEDQNPWWNSWGNNGMQTFVELKPGTNAEQFNKKFAKYIESKNHDAAARPLLLAMKDWRLRSNFEEGKQVGGRIEYVKMFGFIAILIVIIACINFMNLATARSEQRAREVGVRKVMGALRSSLMTQFIGESVVMSFVATFIACMLVIASLPFFNELVAKKLSLGIANPVQWIIFIAIAMLCGLVAGSYPSVYLSSFKPISIFRGFRSGGSSGAAMIRKGLVVSQFVVSIVLIISTIIIYRQIEHVKGRQLGFNKNNLLYVSQKGKINEHLEVIQQDLLNTGIVSNIATCNQRIIQAGNNSGGFQWEGKDPSRDVLITQEYVSPGYINAAGMKLKHGRNFYPDGKSDSSNVIVNETFARILGGKDAVGTIIRRGNTPYTVVGVVEDFVYNDMYKQPEPFMMYCQPRAGNFVFIRLKGNAGAEAALKKIEQVFKSDNPGYPFEYKFLDEEFDKLFKSEMLISKLSRLFAILTVIISCLGLFGLAAYTAERRTREIGIRKVLGATVSSVVTLLSGDFMKLVGIAVIIAWPISWYVMNKWLQDYAYRINIQWWVFALAGFLALVIATFTVSTQAIRAAVTNPVKNLRTE
jgi:putative ABC transport system permease protein